MNFKKKMEEAVIAENEGEAAVAIDVPEELDSKSRNQIILDKLNDGSLGRVGDVVLRGLNTKVTRILFSCAAVAVVLYTMYIAFFGMPTILFHRISHVAVILMVCPLVYPSKIFKEGSKIEMVFNAICTVLGLVSAIYALMHWKDFYSYSLSTVDMIFLVTLVVMVLEATRRSIGIPMVFIAIFAIAYCLLGSHFPGALAHKGYTFTRVINMICVGTEGLFSSTLGTAAVEIAAFMIFSALLQVSGALQYFMRLAFALAGGFSGGPAKVAVISSAMMGMVSGSTVANVTATGSLTIPLMKMMGFKPTYAGSVEACSSAGGSITPPVLGATAFLIAEMLDRSYWEIAVAAVIPAILYYVSLFNSVHIRSVKEGLVGIDREYLPKLWVSFKAALFLILPLAILIGLMAMQYSALLSAIYSTLALFAVTMIKKETRLSLDGLGKVCRIALKSMVSVSTACASAGVIVATLAMTGLGQKVGSIITEFAGGNLVFGLMLTQVAALLLGTGLVTPATYTLLGVLCAPALINMGAVPIAAHLFIFHFAIIGTLTPPVSLAAFAAAGIAGSNPMKTGIAAFRLAFPGFLVPYFFVINPSLIGQGSVLEIVINFATAAVGVMFIDYAIEGFIKHKINWISRILCAVAGIGMVFPNYLISVVAIGVGVAAILLDKLVFGAKQKHLEKVEHHEDTV